eukprot:298881_1
MGCSTSTDEPLINIESNIDKKTIKNNDNPNYLVLYQQLISMGFEDKLSLIASKRFNNIDECMQYIESTTNNKSHQSKSIRKNQIDVDALLAQQLASENAPLANNFSNKMRNVNNNSQMNTDTLLAQQFASHPSNNFTNISNKQQNKNQNVDALLAQQLAAKQINNYSQNNISDSNVLKNNNTNHNNSQQIASVNTDIHVFQSVIVDECNSVEKCLCIERIKLLMELYDKCKKKINATLMEVINEKFNSKYNINQILNDYIHIINNHNSDACFEDIYNILNIDCSLNECASFRRNQRDRMNKLKNENNDSVIDDIKSDTNEHVFIDIMDQIHSYLLHTFDIGYRLNKNEKHILEECLNDDNNNINTSFNAMRKVLNKKRKKIEQKFDRVTYSKFVTKTYDIDQKDDDKDKQQQQQQQEMKENEMTTYSFSHSFKYWDIFNRNRLYVRRKFGSLKEELTSSKNICFIQMDEWNKTQSKAATFLETNHAKQLETKYDWTDYKIKKRSQISISHLMVLIFYTDFDELSFKFSETFRKKNNEETVYDIIEQNSNYHWLSKILRETVECYGHWYEYEEIKYYHGISTLMSFPSTIAKFNHPTSTTKQITVAQTFATNAGCILQIVCYKSIPCFDCAWISSFANEEETLFIGGWQPLKILNIINCSNGEEYRKYLNVLNKLSLFIFEAKPQPLTKPEIEMIDSLFFDNNTLGVPEYVRNIFKAFGNNTKNININIGNIAKYGNKSSYVFWKRFLTSSTDLQTTFINLKNVHKMFKNVEYITLNA